MRSEETRPNRGMGSWLGIRRSQTRLAATAQAVRRPKIAPGYLAPGAALVLFVSGCVSAPRATVELSEIVGNQLKEMQRSHEAFVSLYYDRLRSDVERFVVEEWTPTFLAKAVDNQNFKEASDKYYPVAQLDVSSIRFDVSAVSSDPTIQKTFTDAIQKAIDEQKANWGRTMIGFGRAAVDEIEKKRKELIEPLDVQEQMVLDRLREGYADLVLASMTIKGYLQSVVDLKARQDQVLQKTGLLEQRNQLLDQAVSLNDGAVKALARAKDADAALDQLKKGLNDNNATLAKILGGK